MLKNIDEKRQKEIAERQIKLMEKGFDLGGSTYKNRAELYREVIRPENKK